MQNSHGKSKISLDEFMALDEPKEVDQLVQSFNSGAFFCCHTAIYAQTGIWVEDLVPVFEKLDARIAVSNRKIVGELLRG